MRLHYVDTGPSGTGPGDSGPGDDARLPVLFVPGITDNVDDYVDVLPEFGRRSLVAELRGRGGSDVPAKGYGFEDHVGDVAAVIAHAGLDRFHLATFSRGTGYALGWAVRNPGRVVSVAIGDYLAQEIRPPEGWAEPFLKGKWRGRPVRDRLAEVALRGIEREAMARPMWDELAATGVPVLVMRAGRPGRDGRIGVDDAAIARYRATFARVEIVTFEESDHDLFKPDPTRFPRMVAEFAARHDPY